MKFTSLVPVLNYYLVPNHLNWGVEIFSLGLSVVSQGFLVFRVGPKQTGWFPGGLFRAPRVFFSVWGLFPAGSHWESPAPTWLSGPSFPLEPGWGKAVWAPYTGGGICRGEEALFTGGSNRVLENTGDWVENPPFVLFPHNVVKRGYQPFNSPRK